jgi:ABC-2 type transport system permease protein/lipopolysaccharide transport system permease protein
VAACPLCKRSRKHDGPNQAEKGKDPRVTAEVAIAAEPPKELRFHKPVHIVDVVREVWDSRPLIRALAEREIRAQYKQAWLGLAWAVVNPVILMLVFTLLIRKTAKIDTGGVSPAIFSYVALVPWNFFSSSVTSGGLSIINQMQLVNKIRCAREVFPLASITTSGVNAVIATSVLVVLFALDTFMPPITALWSILAVIVMLVCTVAIALAMSAITVYLRDVRHALPILTQIGLLATPIFYSIDQISERWQIPYVIINPMAAVITTFRDTILYGQGPPWRLLVPAAISSIVMLFVSIRLFRRLELGFADVA